MVSKTWTIRGMYLLFFYSRRGHYVLVRTKLTCILFFLVLFFRQIGNPAYFFVVNAEGHAAPNTTSLVLAVSDTGSRSQTEYRCTCLLSQKRRHFYRHFRVVIKSKIFICLLFPFFLFVSAFWDVFCWLPCFFLLLGYNIPLSFKAFCKIVSLTAANTSLHWQREKRR